MAAAAPRKCLLVTGSPGVGKTTLIIRVVESLKIAHPNLKLQGFFTTKVKLNDGYIYLWIKNKCEGEIREGTERIGFEVVTLDGRKALLASNRLSSRESLSWPTVGRYRVDVASFESLALPELEVKEDTDLFIIDEVGKMELFSPRFFPAVLGVLQSNIPLLATVPLPKYGREIPQVGRLKNHPGATLINLSKSNRDAMKEEIYSNLTELVQKH